MAGTTLAQGSSVTLTLAASDSILIDSGAGGRARIEAVSGVGGAANQAILAVHPGGQATYGPFGAGTVKINAVGGSLAYMQGVAPLVDEGGFAKFGTDERGNVTSLVDGAGNAFLRGALTSGEWVTIPSIFRLRLTGTGTAVIDSRDSLGAVTSEVASYTLTAATDQIEFPYAGDNAVAIRVTLTGTVTAEVI